MSASNLTAYAVVLQGANGVTLAPLCKTPECARDAVSVFEGSRVLGLATIVVEPEPVSGMEYRLRAAPAEQASGQVAAKAREHLAAALDEYGHHQEALNVRNGEDLEEYGVALYAIVAALSAPAVASDYLDAYEGARDDLLDWKGRAQRAEERLRAIGYTGIDASEPPAAGAVPEGATVYRYAEGELYAESDVEPEIRGEFCRVIVPRGYALVPEDMTPDMWEAAMACWSPDDSQGDYLQKAWDAALAAAQKESRDDQ